MSLIHKLIVLVLNRNWQAVNAQSPAAAFVQLASGGASALEIEGPDFIRAVPWEEWITLPIREQDNAIGTVRGPVRIPTVIVLGKFARVPRRRPKLSARTIRQRDGNRCQYTGRVLGVGEGNLDHVLPVSRGGQTVWENVVLSCKEVNSRKGNRLPEEAGLRLLRPPRPLPEMPATALIRNVNGIPDWQLFLCQ